MTQRAAHLDLDWDDQGIPYYEEAPLTFDIPGYEYDHANSDVAITSEFMDPTFGFTFDIAGLKSPRGEYAQLWNDVDFGISNGKTVEEMMRAAENITPQEIADALAANNYAPDDVDDDVTASRHASKRSANLNLVWGKDGDGYVAQLPAIPYYTDDSGNGNSVTVTPYDFYGEKHWKAVFTIILSDGDVAKLDNQDLNLGGQDTADGMMEEVESLDTNDIAYVLYMEGYPNTLPFTASRHASRHASDQPTLGLDWKHGDPASTLGDLDWTRSLGDYAEYEAWLPVLPGYPEMHEKSSLVYVASMGGEYTFWMELALMEEIQPVVLTDLDFDLPHAKTADEMMQEVDSLTIQDILDALTNIGWPPEGGDATAARKARHATRRKANLDVNWDDTFDDDFSSDDFYGEIPIIPGYPGGANIIISPSNTPVHINGIECPWHVICTAFPAQNGGEAVDIDCFEIPDFNPTGSSLEDMRKAVENLSLQDIVGALEAMGIEPEED